MAQSPRHESLVSGTALFVRYAHPPNERGYCGPPDTDSFLGYGRSALADPGTADPRFVTLARAFTGAWPYLELIATCAGIADPLDPRVVEAYWVGNELLDSVDATGLGPLMADRFRRSLPNGSGGLGRYAAAGGRPHHSYHVFCVYPWVGLLASDRMRPHALAVLDKCRIRWARVERVNGGEVSLASQPLAYDGRQLALAPAQTDIAGGADDVLQTLRPGDWVAVHWDWVCDRLTDRQVDSLRRHTTHHLALANERLAGPAPDEVEYPTPPST